MRLRTGLLLATLLSAPVAATAQPIQGIYIGAGAGASFPERVTGTTPGSGYRFLETGFVGVASAGYGFGNGLRLEIEGNYREYGDSHSSNGFVFRRYGGFGNAFFDVDVGSPFVFPYVGAGIGGINNEISPGVGRAYEQANLAYQAIAGSSFPIPGVPGLSLTAEYRFLAQEGVQKRMSTFTIPGSAAFGIPDRTFNNTPFRLREEFDHSLLLGVRYAFNVAPPPVAAVASPPMMVSRQYLVFFDWDRADLTSRARQIIAAAAQNATRVQYTRIEVDGNTDTSGTAAYNQRLSVRRADAVAAELVRDGIPRAAIAIQGFGETHLLVPTAQGVREPQNRRVEIIIR